MTLTAAEILALPVAEQGQYIVLLPADQQDAAWEAKNEKMQAESAAFWANVKAAEPPANARKPRSRRSTAQQDYEDTGIRIIGQDYDAL